MEAIHVKYLPATAVKGSRIKATARVGCGVREVTIGYPHELSGQAVYHKAAESLAAQLGWNTQQRGALMGGCLPDGSYCFVFDNAAAKE